MSILQLVRSSLTVTAYLLRVGLVIGFVEVELRSVKHFDESNILRRGTSLQELELIEPRVWLGELM